MAEQIQMHGLEVRRRIHVRRPAELHNPPKPANTPQWRELMVTLNPKAVEENIKGVQMHGLEVRRRIHVRR
jgi:hypothetical protein